MAIARMVTPNAEPCPIHATWVCTSCHWRRSQANRLYPDHECYFCGGTEGRLVPVVHRDRRWHDECVARLPEWAL